MKKSIIIIFVVLQAFVGQVFAEEVEIDGIRYLLINKVHVAEVINNNYNGDIVIPPSIEHKDVVYSVESIGDDAFWGCTRLSSVSLPNSITSIGNNSFENCSWLASISIPANVTSIGECAFRNCKALTSITIPSSVVSIGDDAFYNCQSLAMVNINSISSWCNIEFGGYFSNPIAYAHSLYLEGMEIKHMVIPNGVESIGNYAFVEFYNLTSLSISNSVTAIGDEAFEHCEYLTTLIIPNSVATIGKSAFGGCASITDLVIPNSVTSIGEAAFEECLGISSLTISQGLTSISDMAFYNCGITSLTIPSNVTTIGNEAFASCAITTLNIPSSVTSIGEGAFCECQKLSSITIPNSVTSIGNNAFAYCYELAKVYCFAETVPQTGKDVFSRSYVNYAQLYVPTKSIDDYKVEPWSYFGEIVTLESVGLNTGSITTGVNEIPSHAVLIQNNGGILSINGAIEGKTISVYNLSGQLLGSATATSETTTINTSLSAGETCIVKIGDKSVKVLLR